MAQNTKRKKGRKHLASAIGIMGLVVTLGVAALAYSKVSGKAIPLIGVLLPFVESRLGLFILGKYSLVPFSLLLGALSLGLLVLPRRHPCTLFLYPLYLAIYFTFSFLVSMSGDGSQVWPHTLYESLMRDKTPKEASLYVVIALLLEILVLFILSPVVFLLNRWLSHKRDFQKRKEEHDLKTRVLTAPSLPEERDEWRERGEAKIAAKRQARMEKREAKFRQKEVAKAEKQEAEVATVTVPLQQDDGHLRFPKVMDVPAIDHLLKKEPQAEPEKNEREQSGISPLEAVKEKVLLEHPVANPVLVESEEEKKAQISGLLQGAMERVGWKGIAPRKDTPSSHPVPNRGFLYEAVKKNSLMNKALAHAGSSFSKMADGVADSTPLQKEEVADVAATCEQAPIAQKEKPCMKKALVEPPVSRPEPVRGESVQEEREPAFPEPKEDDELDDLQSYCGVGGLASANAGKSALLNRKQLDYQAPPMDILADCPMASQELDETTKQKGDRLVQTLDDFGISVTPVSIIKGPTVTMYEIAPAPGVRVGKILGLAENIQLSLPATQVRIVAPIPGKSCVGVEVPNLKRSTVGFKEMLPALDEKPYKVPMILGRNLFGEPICCDVAKTPHLLIAGSTGSGKSVCVNSLICSILYKKSPREVRMVMVDPKVVELQMYNGIPHLLTPVITDSKRALKVLDFCVDEMERRYQLLNSMRVRNIEGYNEKVAQGNVAREKIPYIVIIIDEYADLMTTVGKEMEQRVARLAAKSRAAGIHLVLATQRPSVNVVTGVIKANVPARIAFMVKSTVDSRTILDTSGAEKLLGRGDMLYMNPSEPNPQRIQGAFLSDEECEKIVDFVSSQGEPDYIDEAYFEDEPEKDDHIDGFDEDPEDVADEGDVYQQALSIVVERKCASASFLQRRLRIGYNHAARLVERMEEEGIVGAANGSKPRPLLRYPDSPSLQQLDAGEVASQSDIG